MQGGSPEAHVLLHGYVGTTPEHRAGRWAGKWRGTPSNVGLHACGIRGAAQNAVVCVVRLSGGGGRRPTVGVGPAACLHVMAPRGEVGQGHPHCSTIGAAEGKVGGLSKGQLCLQPPRVIWRTGRVLGRWRAVPALALCGAHCVNGSRIGVFFLQGRSIGWYARSPAVPCRSPRKLPGSCCPRSSTSGTSNCGLRDMWTPTRTSDGAPCGSMILPAGLMHALRHKNGCVGLCCEGGCRRQSGWNPA